MLCAGCPLSSVLSPERPTDSANIDPGRLSGGPTPLYRPTPARERDEEMEIRETTLNYLSLTGLTLTLARPLHLTHLAHNRANQTLNQCPVSPPAHLPYYHIARLKSLDTKTVRNREFVTFIRKLRGKRKLRCSNYIYLYSVLHSISIRKYFYNI